MFLKLRSQGEETPLDHIPKRGMLHDWFIDAYNILVNSKGELRMIPLSELREYRDAFGLVGTFKEFVDIIYAIDELYNIHYAEKSKD